MSENNDLERSLSTAFSNLVSFIFNTDRNGACHDTSAIFYILSSELGFDPKLYIGEVRYPLSGAYFDHSWVEIDGNIYDAAIAYPLPGGVKVSGSIFKSIDQDTGEKTDLEFGFNSESGLDFIAYQVSQQTLDQYETATNSGIWNISSSQGKKLGLDLDEFLLSLKYGNVMREII
ncbi:acetyltransferase [Brenneria sp. 4F2]|nr:acetyltransferase [Brenneria bubanii]